MSARDRGSIRSVAVVAIAMLALAGGLAIGAAPAHADDESAPTDSLATAANDAALSDATPPPQAAAPVRTRAGLEALVPDIANHSYRLPAGPLPFAQRLAVGPGYGWLGSNPLFVLRVAYHPSQWLGYEAALGHNPGQSVHAVLHTFSAVLRRPRPGRLQPYLSAGYGMIVVYPGDALRADPVTKNTLAVGGGLEFYVREDLALRGDVRSATVFGRQQNQEGLVAYDYLQATVGLEFYRFVRP